MRTTIMSFIGRALKDQRGQILPLVALGVVGIVAITGLSVDVGRAYVARTQLQSATNAAALAAAGAVYNTSSTDDALAEAKAYSAGSSSYKNYNSSLGTVSSSLTTLCISSVSACSSTSPVANAIRITESATVNTYFMRLFGVKTLSVGATATASMLGRTNPWNVAIVLDATGSMGNKDSYCNNLTAEQCAMSGIQTMLKAVMPCSSGASSCSPDSADSHFRVSLFSFPNVTTATVSRDYCATSGVPNPGRYTLPQVPTSGSTTGYKPFAYTGTSAYTATYQITPANVGNADANGFLSDYFLSSSTTGLNSSSILVKAVGTTSTNGCLQPPNTSSTGGGWLSFSDSYETYFAGAIYAAQAALQAEQAKVAGLGITSNNAIIFVSDGQANSDYTAFPQNKSTAATGGISVTAHNTKSSGVNLAGTANGYGYYPDFHNDCQQAIAAAQYARSLGTRMYAVAYGSEKNGCVSDTSVVATGSLNIPISSTSDVIPCKVMENIASPGATSDSPWYFYTDGSSTANGCTDSSHTSKDLSSIFGAIAATFTTPRLLPNTLTGTTVTTSTF